MSTAEALTCIKGAYRILLYYSDMGIIIDPKGIGQMKKASGEELTSNADWVVNDVRSLEFFIDGHIKENTTAWDARRAGERSKDCSYGDMMDRTDRVLCAILIFIYNRTCKLCWHCAQYCISNPDFQPRDIDDQDHVHDKMALKDEDGNFVFPSAGGCRQMVSKDRHVSSCIRLEEVWRELQRTVASCKKCNKGGSQLFGNPNNGFFGQKTEFSALLAKDPALHGTFIEPPDYEGRGNPVQYKNRKTPKTSAELAKILAKKEAVAEASRLKRENSAKKTEAKKVEAKKRKAEGDAKRVWNV
jgi:hypothetical protein